VHRNGVTESFAYWRVSGTPLLANQRLLCYRAVRLYWALFYLLSELHLVIVQVKPFVAAFHLYDNREALKRCSVFRQRIAELEQRLETVTEEKEQLSEHMERREMQVFIEH